MRGGLGIKPHYNLAYDESNKSLIFYPCIPFAAVSRIYHPAPLPRCPPDIASPLLSGEAGELKQPSTLKLMVRPGDRTPFCIPCHTFISHPRSMELRGWILVLD